MHTQPKCTGELVPVGPPWLTGDDSHWQCCPIWIPRKTVLRWIFLWLSLCLYFLMQSDFSKKGENGSERLTYLSKIMYLVDGGNGIWTHINETLNLSKPIYCLCFSTPSCQMTLPSRLLRVSPARTLQALGWIQLETTYLSSSCLPQHIISLFTKFSPVASPMLPRITSHRHSCIQACIPGSALRGPQPKTSSEFLDTCLSIIWLSCCHTHRVK